MSDDFKDLLDERAIISSLAAKNQESVLLELTNALAKINRKLDRDSVVRSLLEREKDGTTAIGKGVAIPHVRLKNVETMVFAFGRSVSGIDFHALDEKPVHLFFLLLAPESTSYLKILARISRAIQKDSFVIQIMNSSSAKGILKILKTI